MAIFYDDIPPHLLEWLSKQHIFWVATAALNGDGHVNVSPKATLNCFHVVGKNRVWYEDLTGSGIETISHMREPGNGRITLLFHAMEGPPRILRMWGTGTVYEFGTPEYDQLIPPETRRAGSRAAIVIDVHKVGTSCGYGVPRYQFIAHRTQLERWCDALEQHDRSSLSPSASASNDPNEIIHPNGIKSWWTRENTTSFDGLPGLLYAHKVSVVPVNAFDRHASASASASAGERESKERASARGGSVASAAVAGGWSTSALVGAFMMGVVVSAGYVRWGVRT